MMADNGYKARVMSGALSTGAAQVIRIVLTFASTIIVARLLSPSDYGTYAMAAPVIGFAMLFQNIGFDHAIVQADEVDDVQLSSLLWLNVGLCAVTSIILVAISPLVSVFYHNSASGVLVAASALLLLSTAPNPLYNAMLNRSMRFHAQSLVEIVSSVAGFAATVIAAIILRSYWALWIGSLLSTIANTAMFMILERWRPKFVFRWSAIRTMVGFGGGVSAANISVFVTRNLDNVLLARFWGAAPLGLYDRAYKLMLFPLQNFTGPMSRNVLPVLARTRDDGERFRRAFMLFLQALTAVAVPGILVAAVAAEDVVQVLMGPRWSSAAPIFRWLAAAGALLIVNDAVLSLFIATTRTRALVRWSLFSAVTVIIGFVAGLPWGPLGMAIAYFVGEAIRAPALFVAATRGTSVRVRHLFGLHVVTVFALVADLAVMAVLPTTLPAVVRPGVLLIVSYTASIAAQFLSPFGRELMSIGMRWVGQSGRSLFVTLRRPR